MGCDILSVAKQTTNRKKTNKENNKNIEIHLVNLTTSTDMESILLIAVPHKKIPFGRVKIQVATKILVI